MWSFIVVLLQLLFLSAAEKPIDADDANSWQLSQKLIQNQRRPVLDATVFNSTYIYQPTWPIANVRLGSVTAVSLDNEGNVVLFHRGNHVWNQETFLSNNVYNSKSKGPIRNETVLAFTRDKGNLVYGWGKNLFYMPHGLTIDDKNNVWVTDVALHQVMKFGPRGSNDNALLVLGEAFQPGSGKKKFCKPTSVAVLLNGDFFVADGYCNARIVKYSKDGEQILSWGQNSFSGISFERAPANFFAVPHALTLVPVRELVCVADRENGRIQCFNWNTGMFDSQYHNHLMGDRLFSMAYTPAYGGEFIIVNGPTGELGPRSSGEVAAFVFNINLNKVVSRFEPNEHSFQNPHDVAVTTDASEIYVVELDPQRIHKFIHESIATLSSIKRNGTFSLADRTNDLSSSDKSFTMSDENDINVESRSGGTAVLVASLMLFFTLFTMGMAFLILRRRRQDDDNGGNSRGSLYRKLENSSQKLCQGCP